MSSPVSSVESLCRLVRVVWWLRRGFVIFVSEVGQFINWKTDVVMMMLSVCLCLAGNDCTNHRAQRLLVLQVLIVTDRK